MRLIELRRHPRYQAGFSLVELMISMLLGMFLIGALVSVFISSGQNYRVQQGIVEVQDKGRFTLAKIRESVHRAGFGIEFNAPTNFPIQIITASTDVASCFPAAADSRVVQIRWIDNSLWSQCFYVVGDTLWRSERKDQEAAVNVEIMDGVAHLAFSFSIDADDDGSIDKVDADGNIDRAGGNAYNDKAQVDTNWTQVKGLKIDVIVASSTERVTNLEAPFEQTVPLNSGGATVIENPNRQLLLSLGATFALRNRFQ